MSTSGSRFIVGIDLGTTNSVVAYVDTVTDPGQIHLFSVTQLLELGQVGERRQLPSFLYLPSPHEHPPGALALPWHAERSFVVGELARRQGSRSPTRLVASAKSWLCHAGADRSAPILPWGAAADVERLSPIEASARYLEHVREAWNHSRAAGDASRRLEQQEIILTVPASFDEVARELSVEAARRAGLVHLTLVEEPQAAFYCWLRRHQDTWHEQVQAGQIILVCDVGGGTTDFSLIQVEERASARSDAQWQGAFDEDPKDGQVGPSAGGLGFRRIAVGNHLLLGGDNMDLALAAQIETSLLGTKGKLDSGQWVALQHACRSAKEALLSPDGPANAPVAVPGRGSALVGGTRHHALAREVAVDCVQEGFFPLTELAQAPQRASRTAIQEFGLPYASDPAISRHLAMFLRDPTAQADHGYRVPDLVLFNGGVFKAQLLRQRVVELLTGWFSDAGPPRELNVRVQDLDFAVATGAAYYGLVRRGHGVRIAGGIARSFYVGLEESSPASSAPDDGEQEQLALCVASQGLEEGQEIEVRKRQFDLRIRQPVHFAFMSSSSRPMDQVGDVVSLPTDAVVPLPPIQTVLTSGKRSRAQEVRVRIHTILTEVGTLEIWCVATTGDRRWRLQFDVRQQQGPAADVMFSASGTEISDEELIEPEKLEQGLELIRATFARRPSAPAASFGPERLMKNLEKCLSRRRLDWPPGALRGLWPAVIESAPRRTADASYEIRWLNLAGFLLRPGYGYPLDDWRIKQLWRLFANGVSHRKNAHARAEWWILWRRVAGGLNKGQQTELSRRIIPVLLPSGDRRRSKSRSGKVDQEEVEMWRAVANLERIDAADRQRLATALCESFTRRRPETYEAWALGRLGARVPFYGLADQVVDQRAAQSWIEQLLKRKADYSRDEILALVELSRRSGDRARDIDEPLRTKVLEKLHNADADEHLIELVRDGGQLRPREQALVFGESLPAALRLATDS